MRTTPGEATTSELIDKLSQEWARANAAESKAEHWKRMAERREEALDALGVERNTWARQMSDLHDDRDDAARAKADAEVRMREALDERDDALTRAEKAEAAIARVRAIDPEDHATKSRDYGRGFADAIRLVRAFLGGDA